MYTIIGADQKEYGPVTLDQLRQWITEGRANGQTMIKAEGVAGWKPLAEHPELAGFLAAVSGTPATLPSTPSTTAGRELPNYLVQSILVTLCCCLPFGIVAIIYAAQVNSKLAAGDLRGAAASSQNARKWCWIGFWVGLVSTLIGVAIQVIVVGIGNQGRF